MPRLSSELETRQNPIVTWGSLLTSIGLILLGLHVFIPDFAAWGYGVTPLDDNGKAYLVAAGARDLSLGFVTLYLLKTHRSALGAFFLFVMMIPIADTMIVLRHGTAVWKILPHAMGTVAVATVAFFAFKEQRK